MNFDTRTTQSATTKLTQDITEYKGKPLAQWIIDANKKFTKSGYELTHQTKKLIKFEAPSGTVIYLDKDKINQITLMVDPALDRNTLQSMPGVRQVSDDYKFHSNINDFPTRIKNGKKETHYGWQVHISSADELQKFLVALNEATL